MYSVAERKLLIGRTTIQGFGDVYDFQQFLNKNQSNCIKKHLEVSEKIICFKNHYNFWERELNTYHERIKVSLSSRERKLLEESKALWEESRSATVRFNSRVLDKVYSEKMNSTSTFKRAEEASKLIISITMERALLFREWSLEIEGE